MTPETASDCPVAVNCNEFSSIGSKLSRPLKKQRFTGAVGRKKGIRAGGPGHALFDEISNASLELQSKLLRVVENQKFTRVGGAVELASDFRIVAATNIPLKPAVDAGRFRQDSFFRLNVYTIDIPPAAAQGRHPLMATYYLDRFNQLYARGLGRHFEKCHDGSGQI
ncbi:MAG: sigma 54-interacting transcriptional regulator [Desulfobacterales bacterium]